MGVVKGTYSLATAEVCFCSKKPNKEGDAMVFMFQGIDYIPEFEHYIDPGETLAKFSDDKLYNFAGSHKFTIPKSELDDDKYSSLNNLKPRDRCYLEYGFSPEYYEDAKAKYVKLRFKAVRKKKDTGNGSSYIPTSTTAPSPPPRAGSTAASSSS